MAIALQSCDQCIGMFGREKVECSNGGTCNDGECDCLKGYSGPSCDSLNLCELNDVVCVYGYCDGGDCFCQTGYEGEFCEIESREKFLGQFWVIERCAPLDTFAGHTVTIERDLLDASRITIRNLFNDNQYSNVGFYSRIEATAQPGTARFNIFNQTPDDNEKSISGFGTIEFLEADTTLTIEYSVINGNKEYTCTLSGDKIN